MYLLNATDFHAENLIANCDSLVFIDHETIIQPRIHDRLTKYFGKSDLDKYNNLDKLGDSLLMSGLLPSNDENSSSCVMCGLGYSKKTFGHYYQKTGINQYTKDWKMFFALIIKYNIAQTP